jgi:hypothetical protein
MIRAAHGPGQSRGARGPTMMRGPTSCVSLLNATHHLLQLVGRPEKEASIGRRSLTPLPAR